MLTPCKAPTSQYPNWNNFSEYANHDLLACLHPDLKASRILILNSDSFSRKCKISLNGDKRLAPNLCSSLKSVCTSEKINDRTIVPIHTYKFLFNVGDKQSKKLWNCLKFISAHVTIEKELMSSASMRVIGYSAKGNKEISFATTFELIMAMHKGGGFPEDVTRTILGFCLEQFLISTETTFAAENPPIFYKNLSTQTLRECRAKQGNNTNSCNIVSNNNAQVRASTKSTSENTAQPKKSTVKEWRRALASYFGFEKDSKK